MDLACTVDPNGAPPPTSDEALVELGADTTARDPELHAIPLDWARFLRQHHVAEWLETYAND